MIVIIFVMGKAGTFLGFVISLKREFKDRLKRKVEDNFNRV